MEQLSFGPCCRVLILSTPSKLQSPVGNGVLPLPGDVPSQQQSGGASETQQMLPCLDGLEFPQALTNPSHIKPVSLPLSLKMFDKVPLVLSAKLFGQTGQPSAVHARIYIE